MYIYTSKYDCPAKWFVRYIYVFRHVLTFLWGVCGFSEFYVCRIKCRHRRRGIVTLRNRPYSRRWFGIGLIVGAPLGSQCAPVGRYGGILSLLQQYSIILRSLVCSVLLYVCFAPKIATWLILPEVIRSSQRLSHACLSISINTSKLRMAHYISYSLFDNPLLLGYL